MVVVGEPEEMPSPVYNHIDGIDDDVAIDMDAEPEDESTANSGADDDNVSIYSDSEAGRSDAINSGSDRSAGASASGSGSDTEPPSDAESGARDAAASNSDDERREARTFERMRTGSETEPGKSTGSDADDGEWSKSGARSALGHSKSGSSESDGERRRLQSDAEAARSDSDIEMAESPGCAPSNSNSSSEQRRSYSPASDESRSDGRKRSVSGVEGPASASDPDSSDTDESAHSGSDADDNDADASAHTLAAHTGAESNCAGCLDKYRHDYSTYQSKFGARIANIMRGYGDGPRPMAESVLLVEKIVVQQMRALVNDVMCNAAKRDGDLNVQQCDFEFLMRRSPQKIARLRKYLKDIEFRKRFRDMLNGKSIKKEHDGGDDGADDADHSDGGGDPHDADDVGERRIREAYDEERVRRLVRADHITCMLHGQAYNEFTEARKSSFLWRNFGNSKHLLELLNLPDGWRFSQATFTILGHMVHETIHTLVDYAILTRLNSGNHRQEPLERLIPECKCLVPFTCLAIVVMGAKSDLIRAPARFRSPGTGRLQIGCGSGTGQARDNKSEKTSNGNSRISLPIKHFSTSSSTLLKVHHIQQWSSVRK